MHEHLPIYIYHSFPDFLMSILKRFLRWRFFDQADFFAVFCEYRPKEHIILALMSDYSSPVVTQLSVILAILGSRAVIVDNAVVYGLFLMNWWQNFSVMSIGVVRP